MTIQSIRSYLPWVAGLLCIYIFLTVAASSHIVARNSRMSKTESDRFMHLSFAEDFSVYLAAITMGNAGQILFRNPFSTIDNRLMPNYLYYTVAGWLLKPFHQPPVVVYYLLRTVSELLFVGSVFFISKSIFHQRRLAFLASAFILLTSVLPDEFYLFNATSDFTNWWRGVGALGRFDGRPHYVLAHACLLLAIGSFLYYQRRKSPVVGAFAGFLAGLSVLNVPFAIVPYWLVVVGFYLGSWLKLSSHELRRRFIGNQIAVVVSLLLPSTVLLIIFVVVSSLHPVWKSFAVWEYTFWRRDPYFLSNYYLHLLPLIAFGLPALYWTIRRKSLLFILLLFWSLLPVFSYVTVDLFQFSLGRVGHWNIIVPIVFFAIESYRRLESVTRWRKILQLLCVVYLLISSILVVNESRQQWNSVLSESLASRYYNPRAFTLLLEKMQPYSTKQTRILTGSEIGLLLIADYPVRVHAGIQTHGINWDLDTRQVKAFLYQQMSETEALSYVREHAIDYVLDENEYVWNIRRSPLTYSFLTVEFEFDKFRLYRVLSEKT